MDDWKYQPARDQHLPPDERLKSLQRETGLLGFFAQAGWRFTARSYLKMYHRLTVVDGGRMPRRAPFVCQQILVRQRQFLLSLGSM